nr:cation:proton antiporter [Streptomyces sp. ODS25]
MAGHFYNGKWGGLTEAGDQAVHMRRSAAFGARFLRRGQVSLLPGLPGIVAGSLGALVLGLVTGAVTRPDGLTDHSWYLFLAGLLLGVGLFGSTYEIAPREMRQDLRTVLVAVTLGVVVKASLIAAVMVLAFHRPEYLVLGIAVAQIDPLSVAAMNNRHRMSPRAKSLLSAWASFDDPMTVLLTLYASVLAYQVSGRSGAPSTGPAGDGLAAYALGFGWNALLLAAVAAAWFLPRRLRRRRTKAAGRSRVQEVTALLLLAALLVVAAVWMLMLAVALAGLFLRVDLVRKVIGRAVPVAFLVASFGLGLLVVGGFSPWRGVVLGLAAFGAQAVIALLIVPRLMPGLARTDLVHLALGQQNGITAIILALTLERDFPGTVGIVAPAIVTINLLYYAGNEAWTRRRRQPQEPSAAPPEAALAQAAPEQPAVTPAPIAVAGQHSPPAAGARPCSVRRAATRQPGGPQSASATLADGMSSL